MPPLAPALRRKVDELFLRWLSDPDTQRALHDGLRRIRDAAPHDVTADAARAAGHAGRRRDTPPAPATPPATPPIPATPPPGDGTCAPPLGPAHRGKAPPPAVPASLFPRPRPPPDADSAPPADVAAAVARVERAFARCPGERAGPGDMAAVAQVGVAGGGAGGGGGAGAGQRAGPGDMAAVAQVGVAGGGAGGGAGAGDMAAVAQACGCPLYWKGPLFHAAGGERAGSVSVHAFVAMWRKVLLTCHDDASKFVQLLGTPGRGGLGPEDFVPFLRDVVDTHPGLSFLKEASEFHSCYITTVIQRIFYTVNRSWSGRITCAELRQSRFLQEVARLEAEPDTDRLTAFFSYAHFYVIYCKFWELDANHDLRIDARDLGRHGDHAISSRMIDRIFSGAVTRARRRDGTIGYADFVWFLLSEEDKTTPTSIEYWFRCMDLDGDGVLSASELAHFYEEQARRLEARGVEPLPFRDCVCQVLDMVRPRTPGRITLRDLKRCGLAGAVFDAFFSVHKFLEREQREWAWPPAEAPGDGPAPTPWDRYAAAEFEALVAEEEEEAAAAAGAEPWGDDDDSDGPDPAPVERPLFQLEDEDDDDPL
ncbi:serine/threonine-protein phosphatase 2A regulatory subunit B'' subunit delta-like [Peromyscus eremicus]|uniref:serine/threonine-protein phosphatase 2A regulatory subunit B'' subunit delta-like n=1 Tax=Peromyscus eremicus TaxID=42410 RepID=UPI0027DCF157|nr:serine/threonine-protein phosphatase 2A regulatory subunit B'' subunit delta-like [Peromyscus eremicus]